MQHVIFLIMCLFVVCFFGGISFIDRVFVYLKSNVVVIYAYPDKLMYLLFLQFFIIDLPL